MATYIKKSKLAFPQLYQDIGMIKDKAGRWYPSENTPECVNEYLNYIRSPSRALPNSYATALLTQKFAKYLTEHAPELAIKLRIATQ